MSAIASVTLALSMPSEMMFAADHLTDGGSPFGFGSTQMIGFQPADTVPLARSAKKRLSGYTSWQARL
eukprot:2363384-Pyramimonas_sp.AAC.1